jgi:predicted DNA-binding helix-hairpin-helix protein
LEKIPATVEGLRLREGYTGHIHLKLIPGASFESLERTVELGDWVSLNLEAPNQARLTQPALDKEFAGSMWGRLAWAAELMRRTRAEGRPAARSFTTQFVAGAAGESDGELLDTVDRAHRELDLKRAYFSAFHPIDRSPFSDRPLKALGVTLSWAIPYVLLDGRRAPEQLGLWSWLLRLCEEGK